MSLKHIISMNEGCAFLSVDR